MRFWRISSQTLGCKHHALLRDICGKYQCYYICNNTFKSMWLPNHRILEYASYVVRCQFLIVHPRLRWPFRARMFAITLRENRLWWSIMHRQNVRYCAKIFGNSLCMEFIMFLYPSFKFTMSLHWLRWWIVALRRYAIIWTNVGRVQFFHASLGAEVLYISKVFY